MNEVDVFYRLQEDVYVHQFLRQKYWPISKIISPLYGKSFQINHIRVLFSKDSNLSGQFQY